MNLSQRSEQKELLDRGDIPFEDIRQNMRELDVINKYLGGHRITINGIKHLLKKCIETRSMVICEIGCGGGDNLWAIWQWCKSSNIQVTLIGIDINKHCIAVAAERFAGTDSRFMTCDYIDADFNGKQPDYIFSSLFCHHFGNEELIGMLGWMRANASKGFFINDLHRHRLAYYAILLLTKIFSRSYLVKNDAPLSVLRGFKKSEWQHLIHKAGINNHLICWRWAFRHLIIVPTPIT